MEFQIKIDKYSGVKLYKVNNNIYLILKINEKVCFLQIPNSINFKLDGNDTLRLIVDSANTGTADFFSFFNLLKNVTKNLFAVQKRKLRLKGLGYKCILNNDKKTLGLKVGNSHVIDLEIPFHVKGFNIFKNSVFFNSSDKILSGNFMHKIYLSKPADCYKRKGFTKENMKINIKPIRKK